MYRDRRTSTWEWPDKAEEDGGASGGEVGFRREADRNISSHGGVVELELESVLELFSGSECCTSSIDGLEREDGR